MCSSREVFDVCFDDEGSICYSILGHEEEGVYIISGDLFKFTPHTPEMGLLTIYHPHIYNHELARLNLWHNYPEFWEDVAKIVATMIENYS